MYYIFLDNEHKFVHFTKEQLISKIDRHKRLAFLKVPGEGKEMEMKAGLEIKEKT